MHRSNSESDQAEEGYFAGRRKEEGSEKYGLHAVTLGSGLLALASKMAGCRNIDVMGVKTFVLMLWFGLMSLVASAQCSICSKTASQMGEEATKGINAGILYLA